MPTNRQRTLKQTMAELLPLIRTDLRRLKSRVSEDRWREAERKDRENNDRTPGRNE